MSFREILKYASKYLEACRVLDASVDAWLLLEFVSGMSRSEYLIYADRSITKEQEKQYRLLVEKRGSHIPLQQLTGRAYFMGLEFYVNEHVLIPRMDTEVLVEEVLKLAVDKKHILDMCTGSGCILLSVLDTNNQMQGTGADISAEALQVAGRNAEELQLKAAFVESDLFDKIEGKFDIIVSNPPYIPSAVIPQLMEEVREHEPIAALDGKEDGLYYYRRIVKQAGDYLEADGWLAFEIGHDQGAALLAMMTEAGYEHIRIIKDLAGLDRVAVGQRP